MGITVLGDVLGDWSKHELDDSIYLPAGVNVALDLPVSIVPFDPVFEPGRIFNGQEYLLGIEQIRDVVEGLQDQLGRPPTLEERLRAVIHYARYDAFIDPKDAVGGQELV
ncbi:MAG: hypothetical protein ABI134_09820 [Byssovorax sp.]